MHPLAAASLTSALGTIPAAGFSLLLFLMLILGIKGKGKKKLAVGPAQFVGFLCEVAFLNSPTPWLDLGQAMQAIPANIATIPSLGNVGPTVAVGIFIILALFAKLVPATAAPLGMLVAAAMSSAPGSVWNIPTDLAMSLFQLFGA